MRIPIEYLLDSLTYLNPEFYLEKRDTWIKGVRLIPSDPGHLEPDCLYFCADESQMLPPGSPPCVLICPPGKELPWKPVNCVLLRANVSMAEVFNSVLGMQCLLWDWIREVDASVERNEGLDALMELSTKVFANPLMILTPALRTIACTTGLETDDFLFTELMTTGYVSLESFNLLKDNNYFRTELYSGEMHILPPSNLKKTYSSIKAFNFGGVVGYLGFMQFYNTGPTRGNLQLLEFLNERIAHYLTPEVSSEDFKESQSESYILDIIMGRVTAPSEIIERGFLYAPDYLMSYITIALDLDNHTDMYLAHAREALRQRFPGLLSVVAHNSIVLLLSLNDPNNDYDTFYSSLCAYLDATGAKAGVSEEFSGLEWFRHSYLQASVALTIGRRLSGLEHSEYIQSAVPEAGTRVFHFSKCDVFSMLTGEYVEPGVIRKILDYDEKHNTEYMHILYVFLCEERNFTRTAELLHMHRNTVIYHIQRMSAALNLNLDDPDFRLRILMQYKLYGMGVKDNGERLMAGKSEDG